MKLISLTSSQNSFREVNFKSGVNLIVGKESKEKLKDAQSTYNGVGKTLILRLIHFCLGANPIPTFEQKIPDWDFHLRFEIDGVEYLCSRNTSKQNTIRLNGEEFQFKKLNKHLQSIVFPKSDFQYLTFRSLFPHFARLGEDAYTDWEKITSKANDYQNLIANSYLLGLDAELVSEKFKLRKAHQEIESARQNLEKDPFLKKFFHSEKDITFELADLEEMQQSLSREIAAFNVAKNYDQIKLEADEHSYKLKELRNQRELLSRNIRQIKKSINRYSDIEVDKVVSLYDRAGHILGAAIVKKLEEVQAFHERLLTNRFTRLSKALQDLENNLIEIDNKIELHGMALDDHLRYLNSHGALDDYLSLTSKLASIVTQIDKLTSFKQLRARYEAEEVLARSRLLDADQRSLSYIAENNLPDRNLTLFRSLSKEFYHDKPGGIEISVNTNLNQLRFDLIVKIQDDASSGINEVKIFCYDATVLIAKHLHRVGFLFHDSLLFSNMDHRQRSTVFRTVSYMTRTYNCQYIACLNTDQLTTLSELYSEQEYNTLIKDNIILELTDQSESSKLLGIHVDLSFDKNN